MVFAPRLQVYFEGGALADLALNIDIAAHLLNNSLADRKTESSAGSVALLVLLKFVEIDEQFFHPFFTYSNSCVFDRQLEI